ncbi:MAG TPA: hypothetical protein PLD47_00360 [Aggregatilineales bacterium]|nr:hypothetical protein [Anaerolineales bacterium]HRE46150.1 hypothetical protein [Aggregatilineales bacterium]
MVKQAEKQVKKNPLLPIFALILAGGLFFFALLIANGLVQGEIGKIAQLMTFKASPNRWTATIGIAFGIWLVFIAIAYFVVAVAAGRDPDDSPKIEVTPLRKAKKKQRDWK